MAPPNMKVSDTYFGLFAQWLPVHLQTVAPFATMKVLSALE